MYILMRTTPICDETDDEKRTQKSFTIRFRWEMSTHCLNYDTNFDIKDRDPIPTYK